MTSWVGDIIQSLQTLGGKSTRTQIFEEVKRIRKEPLPKYWREVVQGTILAHSSDSKLFRGRDLFHQVGNGVWALRDQAQTIQSPQISIGHDGPGVQDFLPTESIEEITSILRTIKQYRDYQDPNCSCSNEYVREFFHILGFSTEELGPRLITLSAMGSVHTPKAVVGLIRPGEDFQEIIPGLKWESHIMFAASYYQTDWGILTNGLRLKIINFKSHEPQPTSDWSDLDRIIRNEKLDTFCTIYKVFSYMKGHKTESDDERGKEPKKGGDVNENDLAERHIRRLEFWTRLLRKARTRTTLHAKVSPGKENWISTGAGKSGLGYNYVIRMENARIELYIDRGEAEWNKRAFGTLSHYKAQIETAFGEALDWQRLSDKRACRISYLLSDCGLNNTDRWDELQDQLIESMMRFDKAFRPFIQRID